MWRWHSVCKLYAHTVQQTRARAAGADFLASSDGHPPSRVPSRLVKRFSCIHFQPHWPQAKATPSRSFNWKTARLQAFHCPAPLCLSYSRSLSHSLHRKPGSCPCPCPVGFGFYLTWRNRNSNGNNVLSTSFDPAAAPVHLSTFWMPFRRRPRDGIHIHHDWQVAGIVGMCSTNGIGIRLFRFQKKWSNIYGTSLWQT